MAEDVQEVISELKNRRQSGSAHVWRISGNRGVTPELGKTRKDPSLWDASIQLISWEDELESGVAF